MRDTALLTLPDHHRLAHAFLALTDDGAPAPAAPAVSKTVAAFAAALVLALAAPLTWMAPVPVSAGKLGDQPAATMGNSKAALAAADDEDADGGD